MGCHALLQGNLSDPGIEPTSLTFPALAGGFFTTSTTWKDLKVREQMLVAQSCLPLVNPWTVALQAPLSMKFSRQEYWSGLPFPSPADLPGPGVKPQSPARAGRFFITVPPGKPHRVLDLVSKELDLSSYSCLGI